MTPLERSARLVESLSWRDSETAVERAETWYSKHESAILGVRLSQWEAIRRVGETETVFNLYRNSINRSLNKGGKDVIVTSANDVNEQPERRWKNAELADALVDELSRAAATDQSSLMRELERSLKTLPASAESPTKDAERLRERQAERLRDLDRMRAARAFVGALVTKIRAEQSRRRICVGRSWNEVCEQWASEGAKR